MCTLQNSAYRTGKLPVLQPAASNWDENYFKKLGTLPWGLVETDWLAWTCSHGAWHSNFLESQLVAWQPHSDDTILGTLRHRQASCFKEQSYT